VYESQGDKLRNWRRAIKAAAAQNRLAVVAQVPLEVRLTFVYATTNANKHGKFKATMPDVDKLARAVLDGLTDGKLFVDDAQVIRLVASKRWGTQNGVAVTVREAWDAYADHAFDALF
jgi:Holliday junction resolvase RusA-like endonuclease